MHHTTHTHTHTHTHTMMKPVVARGLGWVVGLAPKVGVITTKVEAEG